MSDQLEEMSEEEKKEHREMLSKAAAEVLQIQAEQERRFRARAEEMKPLQEAWEGEETTEQAK
jgi:hypothetical protein